MTFDQTEPVTDRNQVDPVIEAYKKDIDRTMIRENLRRTVQERVDAFIEFMKAREEFQRAGRAARERR